MKTLAFKNFILLTIFALSTTACSMKDRKEVHSVSVDLPSQWANSSTMNVINHNSSSAKGNYVDPSALGSFNCYALNVRGPGIQPDQRYGCTNSASGMGVVAGFVPITNGSIDMMVPAGPSRTVELIGIQSTVGCPLLNDLLAAGGKGALDSMGDPYVLGSATTDIFDDTAITIYAAFDSSKKAFQGCGDAAVATTNVVITTPVSGSYINSVADSAAYTVSGTCSFSGQPVSVYLDGSTVVATATCSAGAFSKNFTPIVVFSSEGPHSLTAVITDSNSNTFTSAAVNINRDVTAPTASITAPSPYINIANQSAFNVSGTCSDSGSGISGNVSVSISDGTNTNTGTGTCSAGAFSINVDTTITAMNDGNSTISVTAHVVDAAGNSVTTSPTYISKDTTAPNAITQPGWVQSSPFNSVAVTAFWAISGSSDVVTQKIQYYSDSSCNAASGSLITLASFSTTTDSSLTAVDGSTHTFKITSIDAAGNSTTSACSSLMLIDTTAPSAATALGWSPTSPSTPVWTKSNSGDVSQQWIQYFGTADCSANSLTSTNINSATAQTTSAFTAGTNGTVYAYKITSYDAAGNSTVSACSTPLLVQLPIVVAGESHTCALVGGIVKCWGDNTYGQLGSGSMTPASASTPSLVSNLSAVQAIAAGHNHTCVVTSSGGVKCWGDNSGYQLGDGTSTTAKSAPFQVPGLTSGVKSLSAGQYHSCALTTGLTVMCWGNNSSGQLGSATSSTGTPAAVGGGLTGVQAIASGANHTCAALTSSVKCWGDNTDGQLGFTAGGSVNTPGTAVSSLSGSIQGIAAGSSHTCVLNSGYVKCWGNGTNGQLGNSLGANSSLPVTVIDTTGVSSLMGMQGITAGFAHTCAFGSTGMVCWGSNGYGQIGNGTSTGRLYSGAVTSTSTGVTGFNSIAGGFAHTCAFNSTGLWCWGYNSTGQVGDGSGVKQDSPVSITF